MAAAFTGRNGCCGTKVRCCCEACRRISVAAAELLFLEVVAETALVGAIVILETGKAVFIELLHAAGALFALGLFGHAVKQCPGGFAFDEERENAALGIEPLGAGLLVFVGGTLQLVGGILGQGGRGGTEQGKAGE